VPAHWRFAGETRRRNQTARAKRRVRAVVGEDAARDAQRFALRPPFAAPGSPTCNVQLLLQFSAGRDSPAKPRRPSEAAENLGLVGQNVNQGITLLGTRGLHPPGLFAMTPCVSHLVARAERGCCCAAPRNGEGRRGRRLAGPTNSARGPVRFMFPVEDFHHFQRRWMIENAKVHQNPRLSARLRIAVGPVSTHRLGAMGAWVERALGGPILGCL